MREKVIKHTLSPNATKDIQRVYFRFDEDFEFSDEYDEPLNIEAARYVKFIKFRSLEETDRFVLWYKVWQNEKV